MQRYKVDQIKDELNNSFGSDNGLYLVNNEEPPEFEEIKSPWTQCKRSPFIKITVEAKNLNRATSYYDNNNPFTYQIQLSSYCTITLNNNSYTTNQIFHSSPKWREEFKINISNEVTDTLLFEIYSAGIYQNVNNKGERNIPISNDPFFIGFQLLPLSFLEKSNQIGIKSSISLKLINEHPKKYFSKESGSIENIENHNPVSYLITDPNDPSPYIKLVYTFLNSQVMTLINCTVYSILLKNEREHGQKNLVYKLFIKRRDELEWFKEVTLEEIERFRKQMSECSKDILDIPFPSRSMMSYIPFFGKFYDTDDNIGIAQKIKMLDFFFSEICRNTMLYKLEEFNEFFME